MDIMRRCLSSLLAGLMVWAPACQSTPKDKGNANNAGSSLSQTTSNSDLPAELDAYFKYSSRMWKRLIEEDKWRVFVEGEKDLQQIPADNFENAMRSAAGQKVWFVSPDGANLKVIGIRSRIVQSTDNAQVFALEGVDWKKNRKTIIAAQKVTIPGETALTSDEAAKSRLEVERAMTSFMKQIDDFGAGNTDGFGLKGVSPFKITICAVTSIVFLWGLTQGFGGSSSAYSQSMSKYMIYFPLFLTAGLFGTCVVVLYDNPIERKYEEWFGDKKQENNGESKM